MEFKINNHSIGLNHPTYFIADIAANHDGDLERAKQLIRLAKANVKAWVKHAKSLKRVVEY